RKTLIRPYSHSNIPEDSCWLAHPNLVQAFCVPGRAGQAPRLSPMKPNPSQGSSSRRRHSGPKLTTAKQSNIHNSPRERLTETDILFYGPPAAAWQVDEAPF